MARNYPVTHLRPPLADSQAEELNVCTMLEEGNDGDRIDTTVSCCCLVVPTCEIYLVVICWYMYVGISCLFDSAVCFVFPSQQIGWSHPVSFCKASKQATEAAEAAAAATWCSFSWQYTPKSHGESIRIPWHVMSLPIEMAILGSRSPRNYLTKRATVFVSFGTELSIVAGQLNLNSPVLVMAGDPSPAKPHLHGKQGAMRSTRPVRFDLFWWIHFKRNIEGIGHDWTGFISYSYYFLWSFPTLEDVLPGTTRPQRLQRPKQRCQTGAMTPAMDDWLNHQPATSSHVEPPVLLVPSYHDTTGQISVSLVYPSCFGLNLAFCW